METSKKHRPTLGQFGDVASLRSNVVRPKGDPKAIQFKVASADVRRAVPAKM